MAPAFVQPTPLTTRTQVQGTAVCRSKPRTTRTTSAVVRMVAEKKKEESLTDWLYRKIMHNASWGVDDNEEYGYEPFWKEIETAREEEQKKVYKAMEEEK